MRYIHVYIKPVYTCPGEFKGVGGGEGLQSCPHYERTAFGAKKNRDTP